MEVITRKQAKEQGLNRYFTGKPCKHGHIAERTTKDGCCSQCGLIKNKERSEYKKKWYQDNRDSVLERVKNNTDKESRKIYMDKWTKDNKERKAKMDKEYYEENKEAILKKNYERKKERLANDIDFKLNETVRSFIYRLMYKNDITKVGNTEKIVGYTGQQLKSHLESHFTDGMSWDNYGFGEGKWVIDHVYPVAQYIRDGETDPAVINALDNLQPMWFNENLEKSDKVL